MITPDNHLDDNDSIDALDARLTELLAGHADVLISASDSTELQFEPNLERYRLSPAQVAESYDLLDLASRLRQAITPVAPSEEFVARLKSELAGSATPALLVRWRKLPPQYQLAAKLGGLTITAGIMLLAARRGLNAVQSLQHRDDGKSESGLTLNTAG